MAHITPFKSGEPSAAGSLEVNPSSSVATGGGVVTGTSVRCPFTPAKLWEHISRIGIDRASHELSRRVARGAINECWNFTGRPHKLGYAPIRIGGVNFTAHRVAWALAHGRDPGELLVCHCCDNPICCNPAHLWLGTHLDNNRDKSAKGRSGPRQHFPRLPKHAHPPTDYIEPRARIPGRDRRMKLSPEDWIAIQQDPRSYRAISKEYGISGTQVARIKRGITSGNSGSRIDRGSAPVAHGSTLSNGNDCGRRGSSPVAFSSRAGG